MSETLVDRGEEAVPALCRIIVDRKLADEEGPGAWAAYNALAILACIESKAAAPSIIESLDLIPHRPFPDWVISATVAALSPVADTVRDRLETLARDANTHEIVRVTAAQTIYTHAARTGSRREDVEHLLIDLFTNDTSAIFCDLLTNTLSFLNTRRAQAAMKAYFTSTNANVTLQEREYYEIHMRDSDAWDYPDRNIPPEYRFSREGLTQVANAAAEALAEILEEEGIFDDPFEDDIPPPPPTPATSTKVGRNAPCPCGSGRKYKHCCGR